MQNTVSKKQTLLDEREAERQRQLQYGREKLSLVPKNYHEIAKPKINIAVSNGQIKQRKEGHESCLAKVIAERRSIELFLIDGTSSIGELLEFDTLALRIREESGVCCWYFKATMLGFREV